MTRKSKFSLEFKEEIVKEYLQGRSSSEELSSKHGISPRYLRRLALRYQVHGHLVDSDKNIVYDESFKLRCVLWVLENGLSLSEATSKAGIPSDSTLVKWIALYREYGKDGFKAKPRGRPKVMSVPRKKKSQRSSDPQIAALQDELDYLRAENAYLKKLNALIQLEELKTSASRSKPSKN